ncbi:MAG: hypothetical protein K5668_07740 [Lachnospiraceae bacterium]|nr:hypothetical protein [Lachnospiraceae bacterium]
MRQIILITNEKDRYLPYFKKEDFYVTWCPLSVSELRKVRDRSNLIFVCVHGEDYIELKTIGLYLRDLCIEDEKILYLYGDKHSLDIVASLVPSIYIEKTLYSHVHFHVMMEELVKKQVFLENKKPRFLIIDDDSGYVSSLRPYLDPFFQVFVSRFDINEIGMLILRSDILLLSMDGKLMLGEFMGLLRMLLNRGKSGNFRYYYLAPTNRERDRINAGSENGSLAFSKEMEVSRVAGFFTAQYKDK